MARPRQNCWLTVRKGSPNFVIRYRDPKTGRERQRSTGTSVKREAERKLGEHRLLLRRDEIDNENGPSCLEAWEDYENEHLSSLARKTRLKALTSFNSFTNLMDPKRIGDVDATMISRWQTRLLARQISQSTIASYLAHMKAFLRWHVDQGNLRQCPRIRMPARAKRIKGSSLLKGRPLSSGEIDQMLDATQEVVGAKAAESWRHLLKGLHLSGLRLNESLMLYWDRHDMLTVELDGIHPMFRILAEHEKGGKDRLLPMAPEFAQFLREVPIDSRRGPVFNPLDRRGKRRVAFDRASHTISAIGKAANVVVSVSPRTGKQKFASAHDLRRTFGERWAGRLYPQDLQILMRHESIETTLRFYVNRDANKAADTIWDAYNAKQPKFSSK